MCESKDHLRDRSSLLIVAEVTTGTTKDVLRECFAHDFVYLHLVAPTQGTDQRSFCLLDLEFPARSSRGERLGAMRRGIE